MTRRNRVAIDVGGTFTDVVEFAPDSGRLRFDKVPTTPSEPSAGVLAAFGVTDSELTEVAMFTHGTTLGLNALLTRTGARTAVIGTQGFRDVYLLGRNDRRTNYDITYRPRPSLVERVDTFEVAERSLFDGSVHRPLDIEMAREVAQRIAVGGYESVAVAFLHSYANPSHELQMREVLAEVAPAVVVTLSHELSREYREYERTSTAVLDAYIKPIVRSYLRELQAKLANGGFDGRFLMTRSGGGAMTASAAREQPVGLILSGPAGGVIGAAAFAELVGQPNLITIDMGGTSLDASLVIDGEPVNYQGAEFAELPISTPSLYIHTIAAGGGSIVWIDGAGALQVGPQSAGAEPGPASYGRGGTVPTFTDAAVELGYVGATPLGGRLALDAKLATSALEPLAAALELSTRALGRGVVQILTARMVGAVRSITVEMGRDPHDFALLAYGGAGGLVAVDIARELGIPTVIIPPGSGAFSALGMLMADIQYDYARTELRPLAALDAARVTEIFEPMEAEAAEVLNGEGFGVDKQVFTRSVDVRYSGQEHSVTVIIPSDTADVASAVERTFADLHERQYGHTMDDPIEMTTLRLRAIGLVDKPVLPMMAIRGEIELRSEGAREIYLSDQQPSVPYDLYSRESLFAGDEIAGPAVISEHTATIVVHRGDHVRVGDHGEIVIDVDIQRKV